MPHLCCRWSCWLEGELIHSAARTLSNRGWGLRMKVELDDQALNLKAASNWVAIMSEQENRKSWLAPSAKRTLLVP